MHWTWNPSRWLACVGVALLGACTSTDRVAAPSGLHSERPAHHDASAGASACEQRCVLFTTGAPLWSAIANPDSANIPVVIATLAFTPAPADSVMLTLAGETSAIAVLAPDETVDLTDGVSHAKIALRDLGNGAVLWRFATGEPASLRVEINRAQATGTAESLKLAVVSSAAIVSADRPWIAPDDAAALEDALAAGTTGNGSRIGARAAGALVACGTSAVPVFQNGSFCGDNVRFIQAFLADAFLAFGAKFQSDPGHGASHTIVVDFDQPVSSVNVTVYDPTFDGNRMEAFDIRGVRIGVVAFPGNHVPGVLTLQTGTLSGAISQLVLTPAPNDFLNYSMTVTFPLPLTIASVTGDAPGGSFTTAPAENALHLTAQGSAPPPIQWTVANDAAFGFPLQPPGSFLGGLTATPTVPRQDTLRYEGLAHPAPLARTALRFIATASVAADPSTISAPFVIRQSEMDALREEYVEYRIPLPQTALIVQGYQTTTRFTISTLNNGDYSWAVIDPSLPTKLDELQTLAGYSLTITSGFRDPLHYRLHVTPSGGQPRKPQSVHEYGTAADISTARSDRRWRALRVLAKQTSACIEPLEKSTNDHLHVDYDRACPPGW